MDLWTKGIERAISYIRKAFTESDKDGSGSLDLQEASRLFSQPGTLKKLEKLGITADDIEDLFHMVEKDQPAHRTPEIRVEQIIDCLIRLRDPKNFSMRGLRILEKRFGDADADGSGELSKEELVAAFGAEEVLNKLKIAKLAAPDWEVLFEELDVDGSGELTWDELGEGMKMYWEKDMLSCL